MIDIQTLVDHVRTYNPKCNEDLIRRAYEYGKIKHAKQKRQSGELYFTHPIEVAIILAGQKLDDDTIVTALLHDTLEDTDATLNELSNPPSLLHGPKSLIKSLDVCNENSH